MCDPSAIAIGSLILGVVGSVSKNKAAKAEVKQQNESADANRTAALASAVTANRDITQLETQRAAQTTQTIQEADRAARSTQALIRVSAGEAGVDGISVEALLGDVDRQLGSAQASAGRNLDMAIDQLQREKTNNNDVAQGRISQIQKASTSGIDLATGLEIAGQGLGFWAGQITSGAPRITPKGTSNVVKPPPARTGVGDPYYARIGPNL